MIVAFSIGVALAIYVFHLATDPERGDQRAEEEAIVHAARDVLLRYIGADGTLEIVDPLAPNRAIGKTYVYPANGGHEVSGHYRRGETGAWHPFLLRLDADGQLVELAVRDADGGLRRRAAGDPRLSIRPD